MNDKQDPLERPLDNDPDAVKPSSRLVPRPSEVHPLNAVTGTPPPAEVNDELSETELLAAIALEGQHLEPHGDEATTRSSSPPGRTSLVPPSRLTTTLNANASESMSARISRMPKAPSSGPTSAPELEISQGDTLEQADGGPPMSQAPKASAPPARSSVPASRLRSSSLAPSRSLSAAPSQASLSLRPVALRPNTSIPPSSLKAKGLRPTSIHPNVDKLSLPNEEPVACEANETLRDNKLREAILKRAQSTVAHANTLADANKRARHYVIASELYAMVGLPQTALLLAERAGKLGNHLGHRQVRQLAHSTGDEKAASHAFNSEISSAPSSEVRRHVAAAATHFERWVRKDALAATRNSELLQRLVPQDPGPLLLKLGRQLGQGAAAPQTLAWLPESHRQLISANVSLQKLRGDVQRMGDDCNDPVATFLEVRAALERRDRVAAAKGLLNLRQQAGYERAVVWLAAALLSPVAATRDKAVELFEQLYEQQPNKLLRRVLSARAVESGNRAALTSVLEADDKQENHQHALTCADKLALTALGLCTTNLQALADEANLPTTRPLFRALAYASKQAHLASSSQTENANDTSPRSPDEERSGADVIVERIQELEAAYRQADTEVVANTLLSLEGLDRPEHLHFVAATVTATEPPTQQNTRWLAAALASEVCGAAALHTLLAHSPRQQAAALLETVAQNAPSSEQRAMFLAHAALVASDTAEQVRLSTAAYAADPTHALVEAVTQRYAPPTTSSSADESSRPSGHSGRATPIEPPSSRSPLVNQLVSISNAQSMSGRSHFERALALVRQALRSPAGNTRDTLLAHAAELLPEDVTLLDLVEKNAPQQPAERAHRRELSLSRVNGAETRASLRTESALYYELAGQFSDAARVSQEPADGVTAWQWCFQRNAPGTEFASVLRKRVVDRASSAPSQVERANGWLHAAKLAADAGDWAAERTAVDNAIRLDPNHLEGLLAAEALAFKDGEAERIAEVEALLAEAFPAPDSLAHGRLAVRFLQANGGSSSGYTLLLECAESGTPSLDVARRLTYLAPRMGDDEVAYDMVQHLRGAAVTAHDEAVLLLHAANLALKMGRTNAALGHLDQALEASSDYVAALAMRAQLLASQDHYAQAAHAYEQLASSAASSTLRGQAFKRAAELLLRAASGASTMMDGSQTGLALPFTPAALAAIDLPRLSLNLSRAWAHLPDDAWVFELLVQTYVAQKLAEPLSELFAKRLARASQEQRSALALRFGQACHALGADERALQLVNDVLTERPDDEQALTLLAKLAPNDAEREKTLLQLVRVSSTPAQQAAAYKQLGNFYRASAPQALRAVRSFQEVLKRDPTDSDAVRAVVELQIGNDDLDGAQQTLGTYVERAKSATAQHLVAVLRAVIASARDPRNGAEVLEQLLTAHPADEVALGELTNLYVRTKQADKLSELVNRTRDFAMQQIPVGDQLVASLKCVARLAQATGETSTLTLAKAMSSLYHGVESGLDARGSRALSKSLDDVLAPAPLHGSVRSFLALTGELVKPSVKLLEEQRIADKRIRAAFEMKARASGVATPDLYTSEKDPYCCLILHAPARIVLGAMWVREAPQSVLDFLAWRCLKALQTGIGAYVHLSNHEALLHIDALLRRYVDTQDVLVPVEERLDLDDSLLLSRESWPHGGPAPDVLATEVLQHLIQGDLEFGDALRLWVNRCALLATGEPRTGLQSIAFANGELNTVIPGDAIAFAARNAEARHLLRSMLDPGVAAAHHSLNG